MRKILSLLFFVLCAINVYAQKPYELDKSYKSQGTFNSSTWGAERDQQGRILVIGAFTKYRGADYNNFIRLYKDGSVDTTFKPAAYTSVGAIKMLSNGQILASVATGGSAPSMIVRLNEDGSVDPSYASNTISNEKILAMFSDGRVLLARYNVSPETLRMLQPDGTVNTSFNANPFIAGETNGRTYATTIQTDGKLLISVSTYLGIYVIRLNTDGSRDASFGVVKTNSPITAFALQNDGKILGAGSFSYYNSYTPQYNIIRFNTDGTVDTAFKPQWFTQYYSPTSFGGYTLHVTPDSKILFGYSYYNPCCMNSWNDRATVYRLNVDGSTDNSFIINVSQGTAVAHVYNDKIYLTGNFWTCNATTRNGFAVCNAADGSIDRQFYTMASTNHYDVTKRMIVLPDKKILAVTNAYGNSGFGDSPSTITRLLPDGNTDTTFAQLGFNVSYNACQSDGKLIVSVTGTTPSLKRLNYDGTFDADFPATPQRNASSAEVLPDGKILAMIQTGNGYTFALVRLNADGSDDPGFVKDTFNMSTNFVVQPDGKIVIYGNATTINNSPFSRILRLNTDGSIDNAFTSTGTNNQIRSCVLLPSGKIFIGGYFTTCNGSNQKGIALLLPDGSTDPSFSCGEVEQITSILPYESNSFILSGDFVSNSLLIRIDSLGNSYPAYNYTNPDILYSTLVEGLSTYDKDRFFVYGNLNGTSDYNPVSDVMRLYFGNTKSDNVISGIVYEDASMNCKKEYAEKFLPGIIIKAEPISKYSSTNTKGVYAFLSDTSVHQLTLTPVYNTWQQQLYGSKCQTSYVANIGAGPIDTAGFDLADTLRHCSLLKADIITSNKRPCSRSSVVVTYNNLGTDQISNVRLAVTFPAHISPLNSTPAWTDRKGSVIYFDLASVPPGSSGKILITDTVSCIPSLANTPACFKVSMNRRGTCADETPAGWDQSDMVVYGKCINEECRFVVKNDGHGSMSDSSAFRLYRNDTLIYSANYKLIAGDSLVISYFSHGNTMRLEADQRPLHPGRSLPRFTLQGCGSGALHTTDVLSIAEDDEDLHTEYACVYIRYSYDPNSKEAEPVGRSDEHYIKSTDKIDYTIHFQNTGTDEAYVVKIVDTLDANIDLSTIEFGAASHQYTWGVSGQGRPVITFTFDNIHLPDSTTSYEESQGYVKYSVYPVDGIAQGVTIHNTAYIYFDYNDPVQTNEVFHEINDLEISAMTTETVSVVVTGVHPASFIPGLSVSPNPFSGQVSVTTSKGQIQSVELYNLQGMKILSLSGEGMSAQVNTESVNPGIYLMRITMANGTSQVVKLLKY